VLDGIATLDMLYPERGSLVAIAAAIALIGCGAMGGIGFLTPAVQSVAAAILTLRISDHLWSGGFTALPVHLPSAILAAAIAVSLALAGPGAYSIDAYLFGRREIRIPPRITSADVDDSVRISMISVVLALLLLLPALRAVA
jgi:hypothetical protein